MFSCSLAGGLFLCRSIYRFAFNCSGELTISCSAFYAQLTSWGHDIFINSMNGSEIASEIPSAFLFCEKNLILPPFSKFKEYPHSFHNRSANWLVSVGRFVYSCCCFNNTTYYDQAEKATTLKYCRHKLRNEILNLFMKRDDSLDMISSPSE